ncbi:DUF2975 domain-containing protein [Aquibacillus kalidii]|uniref:DUF2975 domain-containing protein n=1 Tax=Aquibacillus kalidii TaxID=2762597 RepID=UPI001647A2FA|nr:DUF2975 domain-containing protein [Aquibacillus kalidii]
MAKGLLNNLKQIKTILLKIAIFVIAVTIGVLSVFWLPWQANILVNMYPEFDYLEYPLLVGIYLSTIPFFFALYHGYQLLIYIDKNMAFSDLSVKSLKRIKYCGIAIAILYVIGFIILFTEDAEQPGILLLGLVIMFASVVIAVFSAVLQNLLKSALEIKKENDLTV